MTAAPEHTLPGRDARSSASRRVLSRGVSLLAEGDTRVGLAELLLASVIILVASFALYLSHIRHGSFYYDDWANAALTTYPPHPGYGGALSEYFSLFGFRPLLAWYTPTLQEVLGMHEHLHIAWSVLLLCAMSCAFYLTLRTLGMERVHAVALAVLALVFPFSDSSTLWSQAASGHLVAMLYLLGLVAAIHGLRAKDRRRALWWHTGSLVLYLAAVTTYELVATAALASVLIYVWQTSLRRALARFVADVIVIGAALAWTTSHTAIDVVSSGGGALSHVHLLANNGLTIIAQALEPFGNPPRLLVIAVALIVVAVGLVAWQRSAHGSMRRVQLCRWLATAAAGVVFSYIAWAVFVPSNVYYEPTTLGVGNRTNCLAVLGIVMVAYSLAMIIGSLSSQPSSRRPLLATCFALAVTVALGAAYVHRVRRDIHNWNKATRIQDQVFTAMRTTVPQPIPHATIYAYGFVNYPAPGVPSFAASWDLNGAVKILYHDGTLSGYPVFLSSAMVCAPRGMYPDQDGYSSRFGTPYGHAILVNVSGPSAAAPLNQAQCDRAIGRPTSATS